MFSDKALTFLKQLKRNNKREWFQERKPQFDELLLNPMRELVEQMDVRLAAFAPEIIGSPKRSIFRIYRDTRFSKDKTPYKTHVACWFSHSRSSHGVGSETHGAGAGYYFHLEPGASLVAGGIWMPPRPSLNAIRESVAGNHGQLVKILGGASFKRRFGTLNPEHRLIRVPRPWAKDHPAADWLRFSSFTVSAALTDADVLGSGLAKKVEKDFSTMLPLVRWLNNALGYPAQARR